MTPNQHTEHLRLEMLEANKMFVTMVMLVIKQVPCEPAEGRAVSPLWYSTANLKLLFVRHSLIPQVPYAVAILNSVGPLLSFKIKIYVTWWGPRWYEHDL